MENDEDEAGRASKRAKGKAAEEASFVRGAKVEVSIEEEGFRGSWHAATIVRPLSKKANKLYVQYDLLNKSDDDPTPLREHVNPILVRPPPPREPGRSFRIDEDVDAFHKDGWWEGVVTAVHPPAPPPSTSPTYSIFFRNAREQIQFPAADIRLHREWVYGDWVPPLEPPRPPPPPPAAAPHG